MFEYFLFNLFGARAVLISLLESLFHKIIVERQTADLGRR